MKNVVVVFTLFFVLTGWTKGNDPSSDSSGSVKVTLNKEQLGALDAAIGQMKKLGRTYKGQQVVINDEGTNIIITFMDDPIDIRVAGGQHATVWEVRKKDAKVLRELLAR